MNAVIGIGTMWFGFACAFTGMFALGGDADSRQERRLWRMLGGSLIAAGCLMMYDGLVQLAGVT